jgi:hypothetical protein
MMREIRKNEKKFRSLGGKKNRWKEKKKRKRRGQGAGGGSGGG